jgi:ACS family glucarate transporter-like MFS transporter
MTAPLNQQAPTHVRYLVLVWLCAAAMIAYTQRNTLGAVEKDMREELSLTSDESAKIMATGFFATYALGQVPAGWLGQVWGSRRALALFSAICSAATGLCAAAGRLPVFVFLRATMGINQAGLFPCTTGTIKSWFPGSQWGMANGFLTAFQQVGGAGGTIVAAYVGTLLGWRWTFAVFAVPGMIWAIWFYYWFRDRPEEHASVSDGELALLRTSAEQALRSSDTEQAEPIPWVALLLSPALFWICFQQFFRGAGYIFYSTWFPTYLRDSFGVTREAAGWMTSMPLWANAIGCIAGGAFSDWLLQRSGSRRISRQGLAVVSQLACAGLTFVAIRVPDPTTFVAIMSFGSFCAAAGGPLAYAVSIDMGGKHVRPIFSLMNMWGNLGSLAFPMVVARLIGEHPKPADWAPVLPAFGIIYLIAGLAWLGFNPDRQILPAEAPAPPED